MAKKRRKRKNGFYFDYSLLFVLIFIVGFGLTMIYSTSSYTAQINYGNPEYYFKRQLIFDLLGFVCMFFKKGRSLDICYITFNGVSSYSIWT